MSCQDCEKAQAEGVVYYFRWKKANIALSGCKVHINEAMRVLREEAMKT